MLIQTKLFAALLAASAIAAPVLTTPAEARAGAWQRHHPARTHINHRIARQQVRITRQVRQGDMTRTEARGLRGDLRSVRKQERQYAQANGNNGHLTRSQVRDLNHDLNQTGRAIRN
jgi:hypothetical protein